MHYIMSGEEIYEKVKAKCNYPAKPLNHYMMMKIEKSANLRTSSRAINITSGWADFDGNPCFYGNGVYHPYFRLSSFIEDRTELASDIRFDTLGDKNSRMREEQANALIKLAASTKCKIIIVISNIWKSRGRLNNRILGYEKRIEIPTTAKSYDDFYITDELIEDKSTCMKMLNEIRDYCSYVSNKLKNYKFHNTY